jgi:hypothetical protein
VDSEVEVVDDENFEESENEDGEGEEEEEDGDEVEEVRPQPLASTSSRRPSTSGAGKKTTTAPKNPAPARSNTARKPVARRKSLPKRSKAQVVDGATGEEVEVVSATTSRRGTLPRKVKKDAPTMAPEGEGEEEGAEIVEGTGEVARSAGSLKGKERAIEFDVEDDVGLQEDLPESVLGKRKIKEEPVDHYDLFGGAGDNEEGPAKKMAYPGLHDVVLN